MKKQAENSGNLKPIIQPGLIAPKQNGKAATTKSQSKATKKR